MYDTQLIYSETSPAVTSLYSPWFPRQADNAWFTLEILDTSAASNGAFIVVYAYTKNTDDKGDGTQLPAPIIDVGPTLSWSSLVPGLYSREFGPNGHSGWGDTLGFGELVRYGVGFGSVSGNREWILMRMLQPSWFDALVEA